MQTVSSNTDPSGKKKNKEEKHYRKSWQGFYRWQVPGSHLSRLVCTSGCDTSSAFLKKVWNFFASKGCKTRSWFLSLDKLPVQWLEPC